MGVSTSTIPQSAWARSTHENSMERKRSGIQGVNRAEAIIIEVYDRDVLNATELPLKLAPKVLQNPGLIWAQLKRVGTETIHYVAFDGAQAEVVSSNSVQLVGQTVEIVYNGFDIDTGSPKAYLKGRPKMRRLSSDKASETSDMGSVIG